MGRRKTLWTALKMMVFEAMPMASVSTTTAVKRRDLVRSRMAYDRSFQRSFIYTSEQVSRTLSSRYDSVDELSIFTVRHDLAVGSV
jgi:hypothetical protein